MVDKNHTDEQFDDSARQDRLTVYNGGALLPHSREVSTGFYDEIEPVDPTLESMAEAATVAHEQDDRLETEAGDAGSDGTKENDEVGTLPQGANSIAPEVKKKKKKKSKRSKAQRGVDKPTGFEENFADAPLTPEQHAEEQELYHPDLPLIDRIQTAIQRFERTRRLESHRRDIFYKYLAYGGVDVGPNSFSGGIDAAAAEEMDKNQLVAALARASITAEKRNLDSPDSKYAIDFEACMKGFLSRRASLYYAFETEAQVEVVTSTLSRFVEYLLQHDVCPEFSKELLSTRDICKLATKELWACAEAQRWLPGDFNVACSTLFGGSYQGKYDGMTSWEPVDSKLTFKQDSFVGMDDETAMQVVNYGVAGAADEMVYQLYMKMTDTNEFKIVEVREGAGFEITKIEPVRPDTKELYKTQTKNFRPVGRVHAKAWKNPDSPLEDLTVEERKSLATRGSQPEETYLFFIEEVIQQHLFVGIKLEATVRKLNCGIWFFDDFFKTYCTFDTFLYNEMMVGWKEPRPLPGALDYVGDGNDIGEPADDEGAGDA